ncbi:MAG: hypothetical protein IIV43_09495, partial [Oscillospiraceae bacterium]|nr:hypothetical protein [Oscillospiraceae bacterium]
MKKRIIALLLVLATMLSLMGSAAPTMIGEGAVSESMIEEVAAAPAADEPVRSGCGNADCTCDKSPWELVGEMQSAALIGVFDRSKTSYTYYKAGDKQPVTVDASVCPAYVILADVYNHAETGKPMVYRADSLDDDFWRSTLAPYPYIDASDFAKVMSAEGMYATVSDAVDTVTVYRDLAQMTDAKSISTADLSGEYVVADFCYEPTTCYDWVVKLVPDEAWPEGKEEYVWMTARSLASLSLTPTRYNASENMGKLAVLSQFTKVYGLSVSGNHDESDSLLFFADEFAADTVLRITDWYWDEETTGLWYQVALENGAFPESTEEYTWPNPAWILQGYTDEIAAGNAALAFVDPELIAIRNELLNQGCLEEFEAVLNGLSADVLARLQASALWYIIEEAYNLLVFSHIYSLGTEEEYNAHAAKYPEAWAYIQADAELKQYADMHLERIRYVAENPENSITLGEVVYVTLPSYTNVAPLWGGGVSAGQPYSAEYLSRSGRSSSGSGANTGDNVDNPIDKPSNDSTAGNGVYLGKSLKYENGQYTIRLESYTTG